MSPFGSLGLVSVRSLGGGVPAACPHTIGHFLAHQNLHISGGLAEIPAGFLAEVSPGNWECRGSAKRGEIMVVDGLFD